MDEAVPLASLRRDFGDRPRPIGRSSAGQTCASRSDTLTSALQEPGDLPWAKMSNPTTLVQDGRGLVAANAGLRRAAMVDDV